MAHTKFDTFLDHILDGYVWTSGDPWAAMFLADTWVPDKGDGSVLAVTAAGAIEVAAPSYLRVPVTSPVKVLDGIGHRGLLDSAIIDFGTPETGFDFDTLLIFELVTDDSDSWLIAAYDVGAQTTDGGSQRFVPDTDGLFQLTAP